MNISTEIKFPIYLNRDGNDLEIVESLQNEDICYVVAGNGLFLKKNFIWGKGLVKVSSLPFLEDISEEQQKIQWLLPKIPSTYLSNCVSFFYKVYELYQSEAVVLIYYNPIESTWLFEPPQQRVFRSGVKYIIPDVDINYILVGSISSRASKPAYFSLKDLNDEENFEGLHVVLGNIDSEIKTSKCCIVMNKHINQISIDTIFNDTNCLSQMVETDNLINSWILNVLKES